MTSSPRSLRRWAGRSTPARCRSFAGWRADITALRALHPDLWDLPTWPANGGAALLKEHRGQEERRGQEEGRE
ncbi:hypothetical protein ABZ816_14770 [Actinosynnema sp. NPDC047251]|uniref:hypothetical protein n=1 Tax=Saccharothrix espanaensis TaxID=103731 RepID=UPI00059D9F75|nr:hypothetical protein [Saccharothrix espanaensis]